MFFNRSRLARRFATRQRGALMLELIIALGLASIMAMGMIRLSDEQDRRTQANVLARQASTLGDALQRYVNDRYATLLTTATPTRPALVRVPDLVTAGYLPTGTAAVNMHGQSMCGLVLRVATPGVARLQAMLVSEGGAGTMDDTVLARVASNIGAAGGGIYQNIPTIANTISGTGGGWSIPIAGSGFAQPNDKGLRCDGSGGAVQLTSGHYAMALWYGKTFNNEDVLYAKEIPGRPDLNTMKTQLGLYVDAGTVKGVAFGSTCAQVGHTAADQYGQMLTCKSNSAGVLSWGNFYSIDTTGTVKFGLGCTMDGASAADSTGVPLVCKNGVWGNFYATAAGVIVGGACPAALAGAFAMDATGSPLVCKSGFWTFPIPTLPSVVVDGACRPDGAVVTASDGRPYVCVGGKWKVLGDLGETSRQDYTAPGSYEWKVPSGVTEVLVTMAGGGEAGSVSIGGTSSEWVGAFPGGSGGYILGHAIRVIPGQTLYLNVGGPGRGGWVMDRAERGQPTTVTGGGTGVNLVCKGGGGDMGRFYPGEGGSCNVMPHGGSTVEPTEIQRGHLQGGQTPIEFGAGGRSGRCWDATGAGSNCAWEKGSDGMSGAIFLRWKSPT